MRYFEEFRLEDGRTCVLRDAEGDDAEVFLRYTRIVREQTNFLTAYPDEPFHSREEVVAHILRSKESPADLKLCAFVEGKIVGSAEFHRLSPREKARHRCTFGISVVKDCWGMGIGTRLTRACICCAREAGLLQMELEVVAENETALRLYEKLGFRIFGQNPRGFRTREGKWQPLILMRLEL